ncbi:MAG TPA: hypothetical protein VK923_07835 [Euzebyales bacterium]|nr:hypothetical protein [Euzebyales bacterium]
MASALTPAPDVAIEAGMQTIGGDDRLRATHAVTVMLAATVLLVALAGGAHAAESGRISDEAQVVLSGRARHHVTAAHARDRLLLDAHPRRRAAGQRPGRQRRLGRPVANAPTGDPLDRDAGTYEITVRGDGVAGLEVVCLAVVEGDRR